MLCAAALLLAIPAWAHEGLPSIATWGAFGAAAPCQRLAAAAVEQCVTAVTAARSTCYAALLAGEPCDAEATTAAVHAARQRALDAIQASCSEAQVAGLTTVGGVAGLMYDAIAACRQFEDDVIEPVYLPGLRAGPDSPMTEQARECVEVTTTASTRLGQFAVRAWRRTFDHIAARDLPMRYKDALLARAARRIDRARRTAQRAVEHRCPPDVFGALYQQQASTWLAQTAQSGSCFSETVYAQGAITCPTAASAAVPQAACVNGFADVYPCNNVDLAAFLPLASIGGGSANDVWGWTDPLTGHEYALLGRSTGMSIVDITSPTQPVYMGNLPAQTSNSLWRGIKVYNNCALVISEAANHGMQVLDLTQLRNVVSPPLTFAPTVHYSLFGNAHTIAINEDTGYAYAVGTNTCSGGLHMIDVHNPLTPTFAGCYSADGYTHETQCVVYNGPDLAYQGHEICFNSNEDTLTIVDVTTKSAPVQLARQGYTGRGYTHQTWLTPDQHYLLMDDELDETNFHHNTRTLIWNVADLNAPAKIGDYFGATAAIDHNQYIRGNYSYQANYRAGLHILDVSNIASAFLQEVAFFDVYPGSDSAAFNGSWSVYPFFPSGTVVVGGIEQGLFVLQPTLGTPGPTGTPTPSRTPTVTRTPTVGVPSVSEPSAGQLLAVSGVTFSWSQVSGATGYDLRVINQGNGVTVFTGSLVGGNSTTTLISLPDGSYEFSLRACTTSACGGFGTRQFSVSLLAPTEAPTITAPTVGAVLTSSVQSLQWTAVTGSGQLPLSYEIELVDVATELTELTVRMPSNFLETITALRSGQFRMRVRACEAGCGPYSDAVEFTANVPAAPSTAPTITQATVDGSNQLSAQWTAVGGAEWYELYVVQPAPAGPGGGALTVAARQVFGTSVTVALPVGAANAVVRACSGNGCGPYSQSAAVSPAGPNPNAPQLGQPLAGSVVDGPVVLFTWSRVPGDDGSNTVYRLYAQDLSRGTTALDVQTTNNFYAAYFNAEGARYDTLVFARPGTAQEVPGPVVGFNVRGVSPSAPTMVAPTHQGTVPAGNVQVGWTSLPGASLYEYFVAVTGQAGTANGVTPGTFVQVPLGAVGGQPTEYSAIARACPAGATCVAGSDAGWGPWSIPAGTGVTNFTVLP